MSSFIRHPSSIVFVSSQQRRGEESFAKASQTALWREQAEIAESE
jgi:hypothetical protein